GDGSVPVHRVGTVGHVEAEGLVLGDQRVDPLHLAVHLIERRIGILRHAAQMVMIEGAHLGDVAFDDGFLEHALSPLRLVTSRTRSFTIHPRTAYLRRSKIACKSSNCSSSLTGPPAELTDRPGCSVMDVLSEVLRAVRLSGAVFFDISA